MGIDARMPHKRNLLKEKRNQMRIEVDLHGYPVWEAVEIAETRIREAWNQPAIESITFIHGAPDVRHQQ
jgi:hypothetical protein